MIDTLILWLSVHNTLWVWSLAATTADSNTVDNVALLGLVSKTVSLVGTGRSRKLGNLVGLTILPCSIKINLELGISFYFLLFEVEELLTLRVTKNAIHQIASFSKVLQGTCMLPFFFN